MLERAPLPLVLALTLGTLPASAAAQETTDDAPVRDEPIARDDPPVRDDIGGADGVPSTSRKRRVADEPWFLETVIPSTSAYFDLRDRLDAEKGLRWDLSAHVLLQEATETISGRTSGGSSILRLQGKWEAYARGTGHMGRLDLRYEDRRTIGGMRSANELGDDTGAGALNPANGYSGSFDSGPSILSWTQFFNHRRSGIAVGWLAYDVYQDLLFVQGFSGGFLNKGIFLNPTIGTTGVGALGAVGQTMVTDQLWIGAMAFDANAQSATWDLDTIDEGEFLKNVEIGWTPSVDRFKRDRAHVTFWEKDERSEAGASRGHGWTFSGSYEFSPGFLPFLRFGESNGGAGVSAERSAALGFELEVEPGQYWSLGGMWAEPSSETFGPGVDDEYAIETSYRFDVVHGISLMPDVQLLIDPARAPDEDAVWVFGLRTLLTL